MKNEKYGVEIEAITSPFEKKMKQLADETKNFGETVKENLGVSLDADTSKLESKLNSIEKEIEKLQNAGKEKMLDIGGEDVKVTFSDAQIPEDKIVRYNQLIDEAKTIQDELSRRYNEQADKVKNLTQVQESGAKSVNEALESEKSTIQQISVSLDDYKNRTISTAQQQEYLRSKIEELKNTLAQADQGFEVGDTTKIEAQIEGLENRLIKLQGQAKNTGSELQNSGKKSITVFTRLKATFSGLGKGFSQLSSNIKSVGKNITNTFKNGIRNIRRFTLSLFGIHTIFTGLTKAINSYLSFDSELNDSIQNNWYALGSLLAPVLERLINLFSIATAYVINFVKALTGVNLVARANAKSLETQAKANAKANKSLTAMDEITNIQDSSSGTDAPQITLPEIDEGPIEKFAKKVQEVIDKIQGKLRLLFSPIEEAWQKFGPKLTQSINNTFNTILSFAGQVAQAVESVWLNGTGTDIIGNAIQLWTQFSNIVGNVVKALQNAFNFDNNGITIIQNIADIFKKIQEFALSIGKSIQKWTVSKGFQTAIEHIVTIVKDLLGVVKEVITWVVDKYDEYLKPIVDELLGLISDVINYIGELWDNVLQPMLGPLIGTLENQLEPILGIISVTLKLLIKIIRNVFQTSTQLIGAVVGFFTKAFKGDMPGALEYFKKYFSVVFNAIKNVFLIVINGIIGFANIAIRGINNNFLNPAKNTIKKFAKAFGRNINLSNVRIPSIPYLDVGTPYVEKDGLAMIHEGEAVVPKKFNSKEYFGNDEQTKALLMELIAAVEEGNEKVPTFNINGKEFARATYEDYKYEQNRLNNNISIRRA